MTNQQRARDVLTGIGWTGAGSSRAADAIAAALDAAEARGAERVAQRMRDLADEIECRCPTGAADGDRFCPRHSTPTVGEIHAALADVAPQEPDR